MYTPAARYQKRMNAYTKKLELYTKKSNSMGNYKLMVFFAGVAAVLTFLFTGQYILMSSVLVLFLLLFIYLSVIHNRLLKKKNYVFAMLQINSMCLKRVEGEWPQFSDVGEEFVDQGHNYSYDLDLFGKASLFQMINMTTTYAGRNKLAGFFLNPLETREDILLRQEAVTELARKLTFRHRLFSNALLLNRNIILAHEPKADKKSKTLLDTMSRLDDVYAWAGEENPLYRSLKFRLFITLLPALTIILAVVSAFGIVPVYLPAAMYVLQFLILGYRANFRNKTFEIVEKHSKSLRIFSSVLKQFETETFESTYINGLKASLKGNANIPAWKQINKLSKIWELIANRYNFLYILVNAAVFWDFHCLAALERWKSVSGRHIEKWFDAIGELEALNSLALMRHDNPEFTMPVIAEDMAEGIAARQLGHPLLTGDRKCNDIRMNAQNPILLITGSNMSGKSTFLRTVGLNLILSYMGLPVCAGSFSCPILKIYACMRTSDNLGQSVSSFYAELLRVKMIVEAVDRNERVFFLLDEIFKGTNSADRHTGARMLINQLDRKGSWGMVSTHDLELAGMEADSGGRIGNYHFKEYYEENKIYFDYQLRKGVSDTRNAIFLMKMAGVSLEESV